MLIYFNLILLLKYSRALRIESTRRLLKHDNSFVLLFELLRLISFKRALLYTKCSRLIDFEVSILIIVFSLLLLW